MRIISGKFRGTIIPSPKQEVVKPTLDRVKENIFNILQFRIAGAKCLDLFCGSGALGIECLSRGASEMCFVDNNKANVEALKIFLRKPIPPPSAHHLKIKSTAIQTVLFYYKLSI